jgi:photosystem II stability/assembly factor-like uncharacterized protein
LNSLKSLTLRVLAVLVLSWTIFALPMHAVNWFPLGPYGGDARCFAADPTNSRHLYLGTASGWIYESKDGGVNWARLSQIRDRNDLIIDHILTDARNPRRLVVGAWIVDHPDGGLFVSEDGGKSWTDIPQMHGQSVRSLTRSDSNPDIMVAGTLQGVFRSTDNGLHWNQISPAGSTEIHEVQSVAIDPKNPQVIYAGTWHLPWKTVDGGEHWENIKKGIIEDSDVFSILVDPIQPQVVYASACSGIYKSMDGAALFKKVQGIPSAARRTRKLEQDPEHLSTVYAGTTEGLYRTLDAGQTWSRVTSDHVIVNDVYVDPRDSGRVLLATERGGVLRSEDFAATFHASNTGFSARQVVAYAADSIHPAVAYAGVVNDKEDGGVFQSVDGGAHWKQDSVGLNGRDVYSLGSTPAGTLLAGTTHGIFRLQGDVWVNTGQWLKNMPRGRRPSTESAASSKDESRLTSQPMIDSIIYSLNSDDSYATFAGTSDGLMRSEDDGIAWTPVSTLHMGEVRFFAVEKNVLLAAGLKRMSLSTNDGAKWIPIALPATLTQISAVAVDGDRNLWVGGREGVFYSADSGVSWRSVHNLETPQVDGVYFDRSGNRILLTTANSTMVFAVQLPDHTVRYWDTGWRLRFARPMGSHLLAATLYDGIVIQPQMVVSGFGSEGAGGGTKSGGAAAGAQRR